MFFSVASVTSEFVNLLACVRTAPRVALAVEILDAPRVRVCFLRGLRGL
jgi:hypothetical protein